MHNKFCDALLLIMHVSMDYELTYKDKMWKREEFENPNTSR